MPSGLCGVLNYTQTNVETRLKHFLAEKVEPLGENRQCSKQSPCPSKKCVHDDNSIRDMGGNSPMHIPDIGFWKATTNEWKLLKVLIYSYPYAT